MNAALGTKQKNDSWKNHVVTTFTGAYDSRKGQPDTSYEHLNLNRLIDLMTNPSCREKHDALAILQSSYNANDARSHKVQRENGEYVVLCGDIDTGDHSLDAVESAISDFFGSEVAYGIYSSAGASTGNQRWRFFVPLDNPHSYQNWELMHCALERSLRKHAIALDMALARAGQPVFLPNVPTNRRTANGEPVFYQFVFKDGRATSVSDEKIYTQIVLELEHRKKTEVLKTQHDEESRRRVVSRAVSVGGSTVETWNKARSINALFHRHGYKQKGDTDHWRGPMQTTSSYAFIDCGSYWISFSETAKNSKIGSVSKSGYVFGDAFDLYAFHEHGNDFNRALRAAGDELTVIDINGVEHTLNETWRLKQVAENANQLLKLNNSEANEDVLTDIERVAVGTQTQDAIALVFRNRFRGKLLYAHSSGCWMEYDGKRWLIDVLLKPFEYARVITREANVRNHKDLARATFFAGVERFAEQTQPSRSLVQTLTLIT